MSLSLLLDEDTQDKILIALLRRSGHDVLTINEANLAGTADDKVLAFACQKDRVLMTHNCFDFLELHTVDSAHAGIFAIFQDANPRNRMGHRAIAKAISNVERAKVPIASQFINLNRWRS